MTLRKWNYKTRKYEKFESPAKIIFLYSENMELTIDCTNCATRLKNGDSYTSLTIHNELGLGYPVCEKCYNNELEEERINE